jgi:hypothetical protein
VTVLVDGMLLRGVGHWSLSEVARKITEASVSSAAN